MSVYTAWHLPAALEALGLLPGSLPPCSCSSTTISVWLWGKSVVKDTYISSDSELGHMPAQKKNSQQLLVSLAVRNFELCTRLAFVGQN